MHTFLFYDIETTGLNKSFDQVLQFAAIRTNQELEEIERHEIKLKLNCDVIPSPQAMITHQIGLTKIQQGISEYHAMLQIHQLFNQPGTISLGYNSLGFDDEFLRFSFYRNLLPSYTHQYANQCGRMDIYAMSVMYYLFKNEVLTWPINSLKLENINDSNQFIKGQAHDAMVDVEATLAIARCFFKEKKMWDYVSGYFNKQIDQRRSQHLQEALMVNGSLGSAKYYQAPVLLLGQHQHYKNQWIWLRLDHEEFNVNTEFKYVIRKKWGEPNFILPQEERFLKHLSSERLELAKKNLAWLQEQKTIYTKIVTDHLNFIYPNYPNTDIQAALYLNGFWTREEETFCKHFHEASPPEKAQLTAKLTSPRLKQLAIRILGRHFPDELSAEQRDYFAEDLLKTTSSVDYLGQQKMTLETALAEINQLKENGDLTPNKKSLLIELEKYLS